MALTQKEKDQRVLKKYKKYCLYLPRFAVEEFEKKVKNEKKNYSQVFTELVQKYILK